jgi:hypothetical protein
MSNCCDRYEIWYSYGGIQGDGVYFGRYVPIFWRKTQPPFMVPICQSTRRHNSENLVWLPCDCFMQIYNNIAFNFLCTFIYLYKEVCRCEGKAFLRCNTNYQILMPSLFPFLFRIRSKMGVGRIFKDIDRLKHSGYYMYHMLQHQKSFVCCLNSVLKRLVWFLKHRAIISLTSINRFVFIMQTQCFFCEVGTEIVYIIYQKLDYDELHSS